MPTEPQAVPQDLSEQRPSGCVTVFLSVAIVVFLVVPPFFAVTITSEFGKFFHDFDATLPEITAILIQMSDTVVVYRYVFFALTVLFVPLALWLLTKVVHKGFILALCMSFHR